MQIKLDLHFDEEIWRPVKIKKYKKLYEVSTMGRVRSLDRTIYIFNYRKKCKIKVIKKGKILKPIDVKTYGEYPVIHLMKDAIKKTYKIHRLVAITFIPNPKNKPDVNHINSNKKDNRVENLEWVTDSENAKHSYFMTNRKNPQLGRKGKLSTNAKKVRQYDKNMNLIKEWDCGMDASIALKINHCGIYSVCRGLWKTSGGFIWKFI